MSLGWIDYTILALYFLFVLAIGFAIRRRVATSEDFLTSRHSVPVWITSLAFLAANLGAQEVVGMCASGAKYGLMTAHFYWLGAVPAMLFVGIFMMPFYYGSRARSVPEYLKLRFDEKTRALNAATFAVMTLFSSGVSMYALGKLFQIVLGFAPLTILALFKTGGWRGMASRIPAVMTHSWRYMSSASENPMGVEVFGLVAGLGFVLSFGYWCTDFLVVQRAMAAE